MFLRRCFIDNNIIGLCALSLLVEIPIFGQDNSQLLGISHTAVQVNMKLLYKQCNVPFTEFNTWAACKMFLQSYALGHLTVELLL